MISSTKKPCVSLVFRKIITLLHVGKSWGMFAEFTAAVKHRLGDRLAGLRQRGLEYLHICLQHDLIISDHHMLGA